MDIFLEWENLGFQFPIHDYLWKSFLKIVLKFHIIISFLLNTSLMINVTVNKTPKNRV